METVVESIGPVRVANERHGDDGQIVVIRPQVVEDVGHVLGNMFQRIYHLVERSRDGNAVMATDLDSVLRRLEAFLQLLMDYISPLSLSLQDVSMADIAESLARQIADGIGRPVMADGVPAGGSLMVDAGRLARAFGLLRLQLRPHAGCDEVQIKAVARAGARALTFGITIPRDCVVERSSESEIQWSVAEKLLEIHGGLLQQSPTGSGDVLWEIMLPLQC